jgi:hypothetical protein
MLLVAPPKDEFPDPRVSVRSHYPKTVRMHFHYARFAEILRDLARLWVEDALGDSEGAKTS